MRQLVPTVVLAASACLKPPAPAPPAATTEPALAPVSGTGAQVVEDFEAAVRTSQEAYVALFDFAAVGEMEILLHRYDLNGRLVISEAERAQFAAEDGTPYPAERERTNVASFYAFLAQRTVGSGACRATTPRTRYGRQLGEPYEPLPAGTPAGYETLRSHANAWLATGGVVRISCQGGRGGLALVWTQSAAPRGYDLITIYDD
ncbi:MAG: hypothetical protein M3680_14385 [Myxococcota bacterium]|nr:hypothetical protein [Myxococcota bacterium]